jgi:predicted nuclease of predicted toxin-antitoxin system
MPIRRKYLIDANLPYYFSLWKDTEYLHVFDIDSNMTDTEIWNYAKLNELTIITKDADFHFRILTSNPPPKVIHLKIGNLSLRQLHTFLTFQWSKILELSEQFKLVNVFADRIEVI